MQAHVIHNLRMLGALLSRDMQVMRARLRADLINAAFLSFFVNFAFGYLGPLMGMERSVVSETFLGMVFGTILFLGFSRVFDDLTDLTYGGFINYRRILPIGNSWFVLSFVISYVIHCFCVTVPILILGSLLLGNRLDLSHAFWPGFAVIYFLVMTFIALFFLGFLFGVTLEWFRASIWQRILTPLHLLGCLFYSWKKASAFSPKFSMVLLLDPFTYCNEGMRAALLNLAQYIPLWISITILSGLIIVLGRLVFQLPEKRLDWV